MRARELGASPGIFETGPKNDIIDVTGVLVGHVTKVEGEDIRTGVTAIRPHEGNIFQEKVPAGIAVGNGFGKFAGSTQIEELGELETPIVLTNTLSVAPAIDALMTWTLSQKSNEEVRSINAVVGETNDGFLNNIQRRVTTPADVLTALSAANSDGVVEGAVGAGTGTVAFGWKGGIGSSSRVLPDSLGGFRVGVLVQSNYGGVLSWDGVQIGKSLRHHYLSHEVSTTADGSIIIIVATDAPLSDRNLKRMANRAIVALGRTGSSMTNGSGDYALAFSTRQSVRRTGERRGCITPYPDLGNDLISPLFQAVLECTEEAILNSLCAAKTVTGNRGTIEAIPLEVVQNMLHQRYFS